MGEKIKNLLIIGHKYSGKSTLANILCKSQDFDESESTVRRKTKDFQENFFNWEGKKYRVVDVKIESIENELYNKIGQVNKLMPEGISQVLFVVGQRPEEEFKSFEEFEVVISKSGIVKYTTIVRTKFKDFKPNSKVENDIKYLRQLNKKIFQEIHIVHVDNPPTHIYVNNDDDDYDNIVDNNRKRREMSRNILLNHLKNICSKDKYYKLKVLDKWDGLKSLELLAKELSKINKKNLLRKIFRK